MERRLRIFTTWVLINLCMIYGIFWILDKLHLKDLNSVHWEYVENPVKDLD